ncbi:MAG: putative ABC transporter permease [Coriobacteriales bacterium]|jgi:uncharacterized membrane protein
MSLYQACAYFLVYSFLGWVVEVAYNSVALGKVVNRGFLNGPVCPLYGTGALVLLLCVSAAGGGAEPSDVPASLMFVVGAVVCTLLELAVGWALERLYHTRWWDYSDKKFNFHGYICLEFSLVWGFTVVLAVKTVHPFVESHTVGAVPEGVGMPICLALLAIMLVDAIVSSAVAHGMDKRIAELGRIRQLMLAASGAMSEAIGSRSIRAAGAVQQGQLQATLAAAQAKDHLDEMAQQAERYRQRYDQLVDELTRGTVAGAGRLLRAFPGMRRSDESERATVGELVQALRDRVSTGTGKGAGTRRRG